jgi:hypothetical protein
LVVGAAGVHESVGQQGEAIEGPLIVDAAGEAEHVRSAPPRVDTHRVKGVANYVSENPALLGQGQPAQCPPHVRSVQAGSNYCRFDGDLIHYVAKVFITTEVLNGVGGRFPAEFATGTVRRAVVEFCERGLGAGTASFQNFSIAKALREAFRRFQREPPAVVQNPYQVAAAFHAKEAQFAVATMVTEVIEQWTRIS